MGYPFRGWEYICHLKSVAVKRHPKRVSLSLLYRNMERLTVQKHKNRLYISNKIRETHENKT